MKHGISNFISIAKRTSDFLRRKGITGVRRLASEEEKRNPRLAKCETGTSRRVGKRGVALTFPLQE